jgi:hypothetical protein
LGNPKDSTSHLCACFQVCSFVNFDHLLENCIHLLPSLELKCVDVFLSWTNHAPNSYYGSCDSLVQ